MSESTLVGTAGVGEGRCRGVEALAHWHPWVQRDLLSKCAGPRSLLTDRVRALASSGWVAPS